MHIELGPRNWRARPKALAAGSSHSCASKLMPVLALKGSEGPNPGRAYASATASISTRHDEAPRTGLRKELFQRLAGRFSVILPKWIGRSLPLHRAWPGTEVVPVHAARSFFPFDT